MSRCTLLLLHLTSSGNRGRNLSVQWSSQYKDQNFLYILQNAEQAPGKDHLDSQLIHK